MLIFLEIINFSTSFTLLFKNIEYISLMYIYYFRFFEKNNCLKFQKEKLSYGKSDLFCQFF
ncbi:hypothetical protein BCR25_09935 [Enterococcus termitis]|uniref:Uncharacterized protein n=1 Tax=Enterococcus termitis TaxID=332950 RepID=A0A1E5GAX8_9ENTE|nr:hypothetical protein BCR25_09935 [Enterococcus termitis]OJG98318.1 hypothetical protein RV18_GL003219 [Enterococcus termitis]